MVLRFWVENTPYADTILENKGSACDMIDQPNRSLGCTHVRRTVPTDAKPLDNSLDEQALGFYLGVFYFSSSRI